MWKERETRGDPAGSFQTSRGHCRVSQLDVCVSARETICECVSVCVFTITPAASKDIKS